MDTHAQKPAASVRLTAQDRRILAWELHRLRPYAWTACPLEEAPAGTPYRKQDRGLLQRVEAGLRRVSRDRP
ncbi:hypothetical protein SUDANB19_01692 [Streptomyces sp. enrichment culture]